MSLFDIYSTSLMFFQFDTNLLLIINIAAAQSFFCSLTTIFLVMLSIFCQGDYFYLRVNCTRTAWTYPTEAHPLLGWTFAIDPHCSSSGSIHESYTRGVTLRLLYPFPSRLFSPSLVRLSRNLHLLCSLCGTLNRSRFLFVYSFSF